MAKLPFGDLILSVRNIRSAAVRAAEMKPDYADVARRLERQFLALIFAGSGWTVAEYMDELRQRAERGMVLEVKLASVDETVLC